MFPTDPKTQKLVARLLTIQADAQWLVRQTEQVLSDADRLLSRSRMVLAVRPVRIREDDVRRN